MHNSFHDEYGDRLAVLSGDGWLESAGSLAGREWKRTFVRFDPRQNVYARLVLESEKPAQRICGVEVAATRDMNGGAAEDLEFDPKIGWIRVRAFPYDEALPTISDVLSQAKDPRVMQYWPAKRCTIKTSTRDCQLIAKIYPRKYLRKKRGAALHASAVALWNAGAAGKLAFHVARPNRWDAESLVLWQHFLHGRHATRALFLEPQKWGQRMGRAAGSLANSCLMPTRYFDSKEQMADSLRYGDELSSRVPFLAPGVHRLLKTLAAKHEFERGERLRPIHGDLHSGQFLIDGDELSLLDFDDFSWGEPERDAAFFLVQAACELEQPCAPDSLRFSFLEGFESAYGPLNSQKLAAYAAHKWLSKSLKAASDIRADGDALAETYLGYALGAVADAANLGHAESWKLFEEVT